MCSRTSWLDKMAFGVLIIGFVLCIICFSAPFWVTLPSYYMWEVGGQTFRGLWMACCSGNADFNQAASFTCMTVGQLPAQGTGPTSCSPVAIGTPGAQGSNDLPGWYMASQAMFCLALIAFFASLLLECVNNCCRCTEPKRCRFSKLVGLLVLLAVVLTTISLSVYGGSSYNDQVFTPQSVGGQGGQLSWAFFLGIAGCLVCFFASILFFIDNCIQTRRYKPVNNQSSSSSAVKTVTENCQSAIDIGQWCTTFGSKPI